MAGQQSGRARSRGSHALNGSDAPPHFHVDDSAQNCLDIVSESRARPLVIVPEHSAVTEASEAAEDAPAEQALEDRRTGLKKL